MQEKKKGVAKVTPMAFGRRMGEDTGPRSVINSTLLTVAYCQHFMYKSNALVF